MELTDFYKKTGKFNPFANTNTEIFIQYNKKFLIPKCAKSRKKCKCFPKKRVVFSFFHPLSYTQILKSYLKKNLKEIEKHNNFLIISRDSKANLTIKKNVKDSLRDHLKTAEIFRDFVFYSEGGMSRKNKKKYLIYLKNQFRKCSHYSNDIHIENYHENSCIIMLYISLYSHYHTIKLFEHFVSKIK